MLFPFENVRPVQQELMDDAHAAIAAGRNFIAHAPAGLGKTAASLSAALTYALENGKTVFFVTPKHSQHRIAVETLQKIKSRCSANVAVVDLIGKKWLCNIPLTDAMSSRDFADYCRALRADERCICYNNTRTKSMALTGVAEEAASRIRAEIMHAEDAKSLCAEMCPYEVMVQAAKSSNVVICDYYHIFDASVRTALFAKTGKSLEESIIIVDESHNLPSRMREIMSDSISTFGLMRSRKEASAFGFKAEAALVDGIEGVLLALGKAKLRDSRECYVTREEFAGAVAGAAGMPLKQLSETLESVADAVREKRQKSYCGHVAHFLENWGGENLGFARILRESKARSGEKIISIVYDCLDPSLAAAKVVDSAHSVMLMSGTLSPPEMYADLLGMERGRTDIRSYASPFPKENRLHLFVPAVTTRFSQRNESQYMKIAECVRGVVEAVPGNVAVFFPSYGVMSSVRDAVGGLSKPVFAETAASSKSSVVKLYKKFVSTDAVLFGVQGGRLSEGVDFANNVLKCVIVVGLSLERPELETQALIEYYDYKFNRGWSYGYIYPAVNRAMQAAGRAIRSETDRAAIVFMDERFLWSNYRAGFPPDFDFRVTKAPELMIREFWKNWN